MTVLYVGAVGENSGAGVVYSFNDPASHLGSASSAPPSQTGQPPPSPPPKPPPSPLLPPPPPPSTRYHISVLSWPARLVVTLTMNLTYAVIERSYKITLT
eukprot:scaffold300441_cov21-Prasinocladus_malaysianus.AAC.1